ncbi:sulfatase [Paenibacillus allorhizosphaerae]|uniref:Arylsulfatase n=1 Tax=Paenibacillus allorhizosphaerae TaxID=2849866 RepID=A0ABM8V9P5_9BACL|nr:sulfatase-like hydrolase/transferase [Paenibacillus allorhizosphaerae]CAG7613869.1 Arylsulfatase [Paenibacillus allorhizosphaerae]
MNQAERKPNILFIMDDQHRFDYLGCMGAEYVRTPNIDHLAERGIRFTHCYTNSPLCVPARISLATGLDPARLGLVDNTHVLDTRHVTMYQRFRDNGYRVHCVGKLDLNKSDRYNGRYGDRPSTYQWGFTHPEECEGKQHAGSSPTPIGPYTHYLEQLGLLQAFYEDYRNRGKKNGYDQSFRDSVLPTEAFEDCYIGRRAAQWIDTVPDDFPWFSFVSFVGPHAPFDPPTAYADKYRHSQVPEAASGKTDGKPAWVRRKEEPIEPYEIAVSRRQYCAAIEAIDDQIGLILDALERRGMLDNTYIVFTSDHGEMLGDHRLYGKTLPYEPSIHVPLVIAGPGIEAGRVSKAMVQLIDLNPTVGALAGLPAQNGIDALSIAELLLENPGKHHRSDIISSCKHFRCIRDDKYKLIMNSDEYIELYDMESDPHELHNIASVHPELVRSLSAQLEQRFAEVSR